jgi:hypothetical protein
MRIWRKRASKDQVLHLQRNQFAQCTISFSYETFQVLVVTLMSLLSFYRSKRDRYILLHCSPIQFCLHRNVHDYIQDRRSSFLQLQTQLPL